MNEAFTVPTIITVTEDSKVTEVSDLEAFRTQVSDADKIFEDLLIDGTATRGDVRYDLADAQALIQRM